MGPCSAAEPTNNKVEVRERGWGGGVERHRLLVRCWQFHYWPQHHQDSGFPQLYAPDYSPALIRNLAAVTSSSAPLQFCRSSLFRNCIPVWFHSLEANQDKRMWQQQFDYYKGCKKKEGIQLLLRPRVQLSKSFNDEYWCCFIYNSQSLKIKV